ncbi:serine/threonine dehydratase [Streptomyces sp. NPDC058405]|uniref:serine/threonine dehydratase n=1 Tax=Streptomyces sp. NPDC058405 TaxID=3346482 RepID=UPI003646B770
MFQPLTYDAVQEAAARIAGRIRPVTVVPVEPGAVATDGAVGRPDPCQVWLVTEYMQHTGSFKARGAMNFLAAHHEAGSLPEAGVTIASGGNAGLACAWAARQHGVPATVFLPERAPGVKVAKLRGYGADVRLIGTEYAEALAACQDFSAETGALASHAYDHPLIAAGAGTLMDEILQRIPDLDTVVVAVGGGGLFAGVATAARHHGVHTVAVEPEDCRALNAALRAGRIVDVPVDSVAADSLGARRTSAIALHAAEQPGVSSVLVPDSRIVHARQALWDDRRIAVEHAAATALAALAPQEDAPAPVGPGTLDDAPLRSYRPRGGERIAVVLCGANTDPSDLVVRTA